MRRWFRRKTPQWHADSIGDKEFSRTEKGIRKNIASARARELTHKAILGFKWLRTFREKRRNAWQETAKTLQEDIDKLDREIESLKEHGRQSALWKEATADKKIAQAELAKLRERMGKAGRRVRQSRTARKLSDLFRKSVEPPKKGGKP